MSTFFHGIFFTAKDLFHRLSDDVEQKSPLFMPEDNSQREKVKVLPTVVPSTQNDTRRESINNTKQLTEPPVPKPVQSKQSIFVQQKSEQKFLNLFDDEPPVLDEPIRNERKPVNLFLDSDEDDDPISSVKKPSSIFSDNATHRPTLLFGNPKMDNEAKEEKSKSGIDNVTAMPRSETKPTSKSNDFGGLFDDDEPPDDFFDIIVRDQGTKIDNKKPEKSQSKTVNLFESDDDDDDDFSKIIGATKKNDSNAPTKERITTVKQMGRSDSSNSSYNSPFKSVENTGPPKSYVSFLDDEPPAFDDDVPSRKSLFDDIEPVTQPIESKVKSPAKIIYDDIAATLQEQSVPTLSTSNKNLVNESPRDEVVAKPPSVTLPRKSPPKVVHDSFDDSSKSTVSVVQASPTPSGKLDDGHSHDETDQSISFKKNLSKFANPEVAKLPVADKDNKPKPNKLKTNFNINVAALLPGAKLPSQKQSTAVQNRVDDSEPEPEPKITKNISEDAPISTGNVKTISSSDVENSSGRLVGLSKNRAKIQVKRKPSTRAGRQTLYKKTLADDNETENLSTETTDSVNSEVHTQERAVEDTPSENVMQIDDEDNNDLLSETTIQHQPPTLESNKTDSNVVGNDEEEEEEDWLKTIDENPSSTGKTDLYEDDWLSETVVKAEPKTSHIMNYDWLTVSNLPPEDINPPSNYPMDDDPEQDDWLTSYTSKEKSSSSAVADLPEDDDDWLMTSDTRNQSHVAVPTASTESVEEDWLRSSVLESEVKMKTDDDDWFTKSLDPPKAPTSETVVADQSREEADSNTSNAKTNKTIESKLFDSDDDNKVSDAVTHSESKVDFTGNIFGSKTETKTYLHSTLFDDDVDEVPDVSKQSPPKKDPGEDKSKMEPKKSLNSKLFDDDEDDDDLFASISSQKSTEKKQKTEAVKTTKSVSIKAAAKSLFSDDDSDPDDLFGTKSKKGKVKVESGKKPTVAKPKKTGLFDDDDDDEDDIFASKTPKQRVAPIDTKKKSSVTKLVATIPASNDPLADLLK